jgi:hypothetical protein
MLYLVNHILRCYSGPEAHFYFLLCMRGYQYLARHMPFVGGIVKSLFTMAMRLRTVLPEDARMLLEEMRGQNQQSQEFLSAYPIDLHATSAENSAATLESLAQEYQEIVGGTSAHAHKHIQVPHGWKGDVALLSTTLTVDGEENAW